MESKEVQKLGLFAGRENVTVKSLKQGPETASPNPTHLSRVNKEVCPDSKGPRHIMAHTGEVVKEPEGLGK